MNSDQRVPEPTQPRLAEVCADLARRLRAGQDCRAEDVLAAQPDPAACPQAGLEVIYTAVGARRELGQKPDRAAWLERFPRWRDDLRQLFEVHEGLVGPPSTASPAGGESWLSPPTAVTPSAPVAGLMAGLLDSPPTVATPPVP